MQLPINQIRRFFSTLPNTRFGYSSADNGKLLAFTWNYDGDHLRYVSKGPNAFCHEIDLLALKSDGMRMDALEVDFFGPIDDRGAKAHNRLIEVGPDKLTNDERCDFARFLLSLEFRRPTTVKWLRQVKQEFMAELDNLSDLIEVMEKEGITERPSVYCEREFGTSIEDSALGILKGATDDPEAGKVLINMQWRVVRLAAGDGSLVLSDRPLIRLKGSKIRSLLGCCL